VHFSEWATALSEEKDTMNLLRKATLLVAALSVLTIATALPAAEYTITDMGVIPGDVTSSALGFNESGQAVGFSTALLHNYPFAFIWQQGTRPKDLGAGIASEAYGINASGQVVGAYERGAFLWQNGMITSLGPLGGAFAINNSGQVVGAAEFGFNQTHAFLWQNGTRTDLGPGSANAINPTGTIARTSNGNVVVWQNGTMITLGPGSAAGINASGQVVGSSNGQAVLWQNGTPTDLGASSAAAINASGQVVGFDGNFGAFFWQNGQLSDLNELIPPDSGWEFLRYASAINDAGQIVGTGTHNGAQHAFLLTPTPAPVPEPSTLLLLGVAGLCLIAWARRGRRQIA
jgi:probable HAF family extracellular repeat protein